MQCFEDIYCESVVVPERTKYDIDYYREFYCPIDVDDSEIISCQWEVVNLDGSRSFKGGLLPENNPLNFTFRFGKIHFSFGNKQWSFSFSKYKDCVRFVNVHQQFKNEQKEKIEDTSNKPDELKEIERAEEESVIINEEKPETQDQPFEVLGAFLSKSIEEDAEESVAREEYVEPTDFQYVIIKIKSSRLRECNGNVYEAARSAWHISLQTAEKYRYAIVALEGMVIGVYEVYMWRMSDIYPDRVEFIGREASKKIKNIFINKYLPAKYIVRGMASPVLYSKNIG